MLTKTINWKTQIPWLTPQLKKLKKKYQLYYKASKSQDDWVRFKWATSMVWKRLRRAEWDHVNTMLSRKDNKRFGKCVKSKTRDNIGNSPPKENEQFQSVFAWEDVSSIQILLGHALPALRPLAITVIGVEKQLAQLNWIRLWALSLANHFHQDN